MLLAGDIGGTKTILGLFEHDGARPHPSSVHTFATLDFADLPTMIAAFLDARPSRPKIAAACFGVAGPVKDDIAELTNVPWRVDARVVGGAFDIPRVALLNDLQAMAYSVPMLEASELRVLQHGDAGAVGNIAVIAAGTGLGEALLHRVGRRFVPVATEGGHADFAARTEREIALLRDLIDRYGRAEVEHVVSGRGLLNVFRVAHRSPCRAGIDLASPDAPAAMSAAALARSCPDCIETLDMFVEAYGAEAGNLALRALATGGVFVGGGIAPKILPLLTAGGFVRAFRAKAPFEQMLAAMPIKVILNADAGLLGAAVYASHDVTGAASSAHQ